MNIKSLLLGSAAALAVVSGAQAADAIVAAEPEPMEYVRVCDAFGTGYFYIPGTETCLKIGGRVRFDVYIADAYTNGSQTGTGTRSRAELFVDTASDTEYGALKTQFIGRWNFDDGIDGVNDGNGVAGHYAAQGQALIAANISLGGFTVGLADTSYDTFVGYAGNVIQDDVIFYGVFETNQITYNYDAGNGFTAVISLEDDNDYGYGPTRDAAGNIITPRSSKGDWAPDVVAGVGYTAGSWGLKVVGGYDESVEEGAIKARLDATFGGVSAFLMGGWNTNGDKQNKFASSNTGNDFGWGDWAVWGGFTAPLAETANFNFQAAYSDEKTLALAANVAWTIVPGLTITPELNYTKWDSASRTGFTGVDDDQWAGVVRFDRKF